MFGSDLAQAWREQRVFAPAAPWAVALALLMLLGPTRLSRQEVGVT